MEEEWQKEKGLCENRATKKKFEVLQPTGVQNHKEMDKQRKAKGDSQTPSSKPTISDCQREQKSRGITEEKRWESDGRDGHRQLGVCREKK